MSTPATSEQIKAKIMLVIHSYPTYGVELQMLITITRELLKDFSLSAPRSDVQAVIDGLNLPTRKRAGTIFYYAADTVQNAVRA